ncbi:MAG: type II toxin-antitoxin system RelE/ParE family toxin [Chitinophagales bacterium]
MIYKVSITEEALQEIRQAKEYYENQQPGLGDNFVEAITVHINSLKTGTVDHKPVIDHIRRVLVVRFPYVIYYTRSENLKSVTILAVLHDRMKNPLSRFG